MFFRCFSIASRWMANWEYIFLTKSSARALWFAARMLTMAVLYSSGSAASIWATVRSPGAS